MTFDYFVAGSAARSVTFGYLAVGLADYSETFGYLAVEPNAVDCPVMRPWAEEVPDLD